MQKTVIQGVNVKGMSTSLPEHKIALDQENEIYVATEHQTTSDLGFHAAKRILTFFNIEITEIGCILFGSRTPDYRSPVTAAILQGRLDLPIDCIAYDINIGANGFIQLTQLGASILKNINKKYALVIVGDTPSKLKDGSVDNIFKISDAASAILLEKTGQSEHELVCFHTTLGVDYDAQILRAGGFRDFKSDIVFDATLEENFVVKTNVEKIKQAANKIDFNIDLSKGAKHVDFAHSTFLNQVSIQDSFFNQKRICADASELPILYAKNHQDLDKDADLVFYSVGEGLSFQMMKWNFQPLVLETQHFNEVFSEHRVSHEM